MPNLINNYRTLLTKIQNTVHRVDIRDLSYHCLLDLASDEGINASARSEAYGCVFGRDSAITAIKLLRVYAKKPIPELLNISRQALMTLVALQGKEVNLESGEEPGKFIHEFRKDNYERLVKKERPWYVYDDGKLRNYDSIDSTALSLIALHKYWQISGDKKFLLSVLDTIEAGLNWTITYGDRDKDFLIEYELPKDRLHGGLPVQSWTDSHESLMLVDGKMPPYPIAPVEAQGFYWLAMRLWADFYLTEHPAFGRKLLSQATKMKKRFNEAFMFKNHGLYFAAQALDGDKNQIKTITGNPLLCLWTSYKEKGFYESIIESVYARDLVKRAFEADLFDADAGIRTMSTLSQTYNPDVTSYHNGSFWPVLNGLIYEGLLMWGFKKEAKKLKSATLKPFEYFKTPIELYIKNDDGKYLEYCSPSGKFGCRHQAWSAATALDLLTP